METIECIVPPSKNAKSPLKAVMLPDVVLPDGYTLDPRTTRQRGLTCHLVALDFPKALHPREELLVHHHRTMLTQKDQRKSIGSSVCLSSPEKGSQRSAEYFDCTDSTKTLTYGLMYAQKALNFSNAWVRGQMVLGSEYKMKQDASKNIDESSHHNETSRDPFQRTGRSAEQARLLKVKQKGLMCRLIMMDFPRKQIQKTALLCPEHEYDN